MGRTHGAMTTQEHFPGAPFQPCPIFSFAVTSPGQTLCPAAPRLLLSPLPSAVPSLQGLQTGQGLSLFTGTSGGSQRVRRQHPPLCSGGASIPWGNETQEGEGWKLLFSFKRRAAVFESSNKVQDQVWDPWPGVGFQYKSHCNSFPSPSSFLPLLP